MNLSSLFLGTVRRTASPLIVFSHSLFECWIERNRVRTLLVQVSQDRGPTLGWSSQIPDATTAMGNAAS